VMRASPFLLIAILVSRSADASPIDARTAALVCRGNTRCVQRLLRAPSTENDWAMIAVACQFARNTDCEHAAMREYLQRFPNGPHAGTFRAVLARGTSSSPPP